MLKKPRCSSYEAIISRKKGRPILLIYFRAKLYIEPFNSWGIIQYRKVKGRLFLCS
ncbi:hypothetical protein Peur_000924 [Populus x canadensis]